MFACSYKVTFKKGCCFGPSHTLCWGLGCCFRSCCCVPSSSDCRCCCCQQLQYGIHVDVESEEDSNSCFSHLWRGQRCKRDEQKHVTSVASVNVTRITVSTIGHDYNLSDIGYTMDIFIRLIPPEVNSKEKPTDVVSRLGKVYHHQIDFTEADSSEIKLCFSKGQLTKAFKPPDPSKNSKKSSKPSNPSENKKGPLNPNPSENKKSSKKSSKPSNPSENEKDPLNPNPSENKKNEEAKMDEIRLDEIRITCEISIAEARSIALRW